MFDCYFNSRNTNLDYCGRRQVHIGEHICSNVPNASDSPDFCERVKEQASLMGNEEYLFPADWNLVLNDSLDTQNYQTVNNPKASYTVLDMIPEFNVVIFITKPKGLLGGENLL